MTPGSWTTMQSRWAAELIPDAPVGRVLDLAPAAQHVGLAAITLANRPLLCVDDDPVARESMMLDADLAGLAGDVEVRSTQTASRQCHETFAVVIMDPDGATAGHDSSVPLDVARACLASAAGHVTDGGHVLIRLDSLERLHHVSETTDLTLVEVRTGERGLVARFDR